MKNILITGARGFIGKHLSSKLSEEKKFNIKEIDRSFGDIISKSTWNKFPKCEIVIHLANKTSVSNSWINPDKFINTNVIGTILALDYCKKNNSKLIFLSSYLYGNSKKIPTDENETVKATNPYALSKKIAEDMCKFYSQYYNVNVVILRPFNAYGLNQKENFLIPSIIKQINTSKVINVKNLESKRDFIYIKDLVDAIVKAINLEKNFEVLNIGSGVSYSVTEVIKIIQQVKGTSFQVKSSEEIQDGEILYTCADIAKAKKLLNWTPIWTLEKGIQDSYGKK